MAKTGDGEPHGSGLEDGRVFGLTRGRGGVGTRSRGRPGAWSRPTRRVAKGAELEAYQRWVPRCGRAVSSMASNEARGRRLRPPPARRSTAAVLATTRSQGVKDGRCLQGPAVRSSALENEGRGMSRQVKGRQPGRLASFRCGCGPGAGWVFSDPTAGPPTPPRELP